MRTRIHLLLLVLFIAGTTKAQDFNFEKLDNPTGSFFNQYIGQIGDEAYLTYFNSSFQSTLYTYDGAGLKTVTGPPDLTYSFSAGQNGDEYFLVFNNVNFENTLVLLDENGFEVLFTVDPTEFFNSFEFQLGGINYFSIFDFNFNNVLRYYDGSQLVDVALPDNTEFGDYLGVINGVTYLALNDNTGSASIFAFDGLNFTPITMPFPTLFIDIAAVMDDGAYLILFDLNFDSNLFFFDGMNLTEIPIPAGFQNFGQYVGKINDRIFFSLTDMNFDQTLAELEPNGNWIPFSNPPGFSYSFSTGPQESDDFLYPAYSDPNFVSTLAIFDGTTLEIIDNPINHQYSNFYRNYKGGLLLSYFDDYFNNQIFFYDNTKLVEVDKPSGFTSGSFRFQYELDLFFEFLNTNFEGTLFSLALNSRPSSADNTVTTERETPYTFSISDFSFSDADESDTFQGIQIVDLPSKGVLHVSGAQVSPQQTVDVGELEMLNYVPLDDGIGDPYDSFTFRVTDGLNFSAETYTIYINITPTVNVHNLEIAAQLSIFPNPASDYVMVRLEDFASAGDLDLYLTSATGRLLEYRRIDESTETIDLNHLAPGFYQLTIRNAQVNLSRSILITR